MTDNYLQNEGNNVYSNTTTMSLLPETNNGNQYTPGNSAQYNQQGYYGMTVSGPQNPADNNQNQYYGQPYYQQNITPQNNFQPNYCPPSNDFQPNNYPPQNNDQPNNNVLFDYSKYNNISELSSKYITQPDENTFIIKHKFMGSNFNLIFFLGIPSIFLVIGILLKSYFIIGFSGFILLSIFPGLFCHPFSYRITLGENTITIKENSCCCANNITYSPGEILNFYVQDDDIKYLDNKGKTRSFGPQDYFKAELEYTVYKLNKFIETKMKPS